MTSRHASMPVEGDETARRSALREAHGLFEAMGASGHAARLATELGP